MLGVGIWEPYGTERDSNTGYTPIKADGGLFLRQLNARKSSGLFNYKHQSTHTGARDPWDISLKSHLQSIHSQTGQLLLLSRHQKPTEGIEATVWGRARGPGFGHSPCRSVRSSPGPFLTLAEDPVHSFCALMSLAAYPTLLINGSLECFTFCGRLAETSRLQDSRPSRKRALSSKPIRRH